MRMCPLCNFDRCDDLATSCRQCGAELTPVGEEVSERIITAAWFHYLKIPKIGTVELVPGKAFAMGGDKGSELVIPKARAAKVATIFWTDGHEEATVREFGAPDPVKVEGLRLKGTRVLKGGEELEVGPLRMNYLKRQTPVEDAISVNRRRRSGPRGREVVQTSKAPRHKQRATAYFEPNVKKLGDLKSKEQPSKVVIADPSKVLLAFSMKKLTGTLRVESRRGRGWVTLMSGAPQYAAFGDLKAERAVQAIARLGRARCQMVPGLPRRGLGQPMTATIRQLLPKGPPPKRPPAGRRPPPRRGPPRRR